MSLAATDFADVHAQGTDAVVSNGDELPMPANPTSGAVLALGLATMGSCTMAFFLSLGLVVIGRGGSITLWASGLSILVLTWLVGLGLAVYFAESRGEWG